VVWREVNTPTRMRHPAAECYRPVGFAIADAPLERDEEGVLWRCFIVERRDQRLRVCERIVDGLGMASLMNATPLPACARSTRPRRSRTVPPLVAEGGGRCRRPAKGR
jgi:hypothetical protein